MITVGITGRSGCGKSTVTACFREHGIPVADADQISREILLPGSPILAALAERFGKDLLDPQTGELRRRMLADRAFATANGKAALDAITHPEIIRRLRVAKMEALACGNPLFAIDGAVIVGTAAQAECDCLLVVTAPYEMSVERIVARDGIRPEMARRRLDAQTPEETLTAQANIVLCNDSTLEQLRAAAQGAINKLLEQAQKGGCEKSP